MIPTLMVLTGLYTAWLIAIKPGPYLERAVPKELAAVQERAERQRAKKKEQHVRQLLRETAVILALRTPPETLNTQTFLQLLQDRCPEKAAQIRLMASTGQLDDSVECRALCELQARPSKPRRSAAPNNQHHQGVTSV